MPKAEGVRVARRKRGPAGPAELRGFLEGQIAEICRDLSVQVKRMRDLQEQADELKRALRVGWPGADD